MGIDKLVSAYSPVPTPDSAIFAPPKPLHHLNAAVPWTEAGRKSRFPPRSDRKGDSITQLGLYLR